MQTFPWRPAGVDLALCGGLPTNLYVIREGADGPLKIGLANAPLERLATLQQGNPRPLELVCSIPARRGMETALHLALRSERLQGEWFRPSPAVLAAVEEIRRIASMVSDYREELPDFGAGDLAVILSDHSLAA